MRPASALLRVSQAFSLLAVVVALSTYAWRGWYARYMFDDFCTAERVQTLGLIGAVEYHRETWSGRFSYFAIKGLLEQIGPATPRFTPTVLMLLMMGAAAWTIRRVTESPWRLGMALSALIVTYAIVDSAPSIENVRGTLLWETGSITYFLPLILFTVWIGLFGWDRSRIVRAIASALLMFVAGGLSETTLAAQGAMTGGAFLLALWLRNRNAAWIAGSGAVATATALAIVATAPGNLVRAATYPPPMSLPAASVRTLSIAYGFFGSYVFVVAAAALLLVGGAGVALGMRSERLQPRIVLQAVAVAAVAYVVAFLPTAWLLPSGPLEHHLDAANYFLMTAVFGASLVLGHHLRHVHVAQSVGVLFCMAGAVIPLRTALHNTTAVERNRQVAADLAEFERQLRPQRGTDVVLDTTKPVALEMLTTDPDYWCNVCVSRYYGLRSIRLAPRTQKAKSR
jgi:hypothetical protein